MLPFAAHAESHRIMTAAPVLTAPVLGPARLAQARIRRCQYRRVVCVVAEALDYDVHCLHPMHRIALPMGDLTVATDVCNACTAPGIFRPDED